MWHAGTVKVTDKITRDGKSEWHSVNELRRHLEKGGGPLTVGKIVLAILFAFLQRHLVVGKVEVHRGVEFRIPAHASRTDGAVR